MRPLLVFRQDGFSLIEVIVILVIGGILAAYLAPYMGTSLSHSSSPVTRLQDVLELHKTMELITADYRARRDTAYANDTNVDLTDLQNDIGSGDQDNSYGQYTVLTNDFIEFASDGSEQGSATSEILKVAITDSSGVILTTLFTQR